MVAISTTVRERIRRSGAILLILGMVLGMVSILATSASAIDTGGKFELDGDPWDAPAVAGDDWSTLFTSATIPNGVAGQSLGRAFIPDLEANDTTYFQGGGSKDQSFIQGPPAAGGPWGWSGTAPDKDDITNAYAASYLTTSGTIVAFGADRFDASGDAQMGFWFFKNAISTTGTASAGAAQPFIGEHTNGDVLVLANFSNGGTAATVSAYQWVGSGGSDGTLDLLSSGGLCNGSASQKVCALTNTGTTPTVSPWPYADKDGSTAFQKNAFVEGAINISALFPGSECFTSFLAETRSSTSVSATLKDFALGGFHSCPEPTLATTSNPTGTNVSPGTAVTDTLTVTGLAQNGFPSGTAAFYLCQPGQTSATVGCPDGAGTLVSTATVGGPSNGFVGTAQATSSNTHTEGTYCWRATYTPDASAHYTAPGGSHTNNTTECFTVVKPNVRIDKTAANTPITAGDVARFVITTTNDGPGTATSVTVSDTLPPGITWTDDKAQCGVSGGVLSCNWGDLTSGTVTTVTVSGTTDAADCGTVPNTATVSATNERANSASDNTDSAEIVVQCPNVEVEKTAANGTINAGETASFTITTTNDGPGTATNVVTTDTLPGGITWTDDSTSCAISGGVLTCNWGNLTSGTVKTVHVSGPTTAANCGTLNNTARVSATNEGRDRGDNSDSASIVVNCGTINLKKTANPAGPVSAGTPIGFTVEVWNTGAGDVTSATVTDTLPTDAGTTWTVGGANAADCAVTGGVLECDFGTIKSSDTTKTVTLSSPTTPATCGVVSNTAHVSTGNDGSANSTANVTVECPDVHVSKVGSAPATAGDQVVYTVGVGNAGPGTATVVSLTDALPSGIVWAETLDQSNACSVSTGASQSLSCNWATVPAGTTYTVAVTGTSSPANCPSITNTAHVTASNEPTHDQSDNSATAVIDVNCADVHVSKTGNGPLVAGAKASFTIGVGNAGPTTASAVTLTDSLPAGITWAEDPNVSECSVTTGSAQTMSCTWSELAPSTTATVTISGTTVAGNCPSISNTATVAARNETVADRADNSASATIQVTCPSPPPPPPPTTTTTTLPPPTTTTAPPQVLPEVITTTTTLPPPTTTTTIKVLGVQLARTGQDTGVWLRLAGLLLVLGGLLLLGSDRRVWVALHRR